MSTDEWTVSLVTPFTRPIRLTTMLTLGFMTVPEGTEREPPANAPTLDTEDEDDEDLQALEWGDSESSSDESTVSNWEDTDEGRIVSVSHHPADGAWPHPAC